MASRSLRIIALVLLVLSALVISPISQPMTEQSPRTDHVLSRRIFAEPLPQNNGKSLELVEVSLGPASRVVNLEGGKGCQTTIYVADGTLRFEASGPSDEAKIYGAGSAFSEHTHHVHTFYRNASTIREARYLRVSLCNHDVAQR